MIAVMFRRARLTRPLSSFAAGAGLVAASSCERRHVHADGRPEGARRTPRVLTIRGAPRQRGRLLGTLLAADIHELAAHRRKMYSCRGISLWDELSSRLSTSWREHATTSWEELQGMVDAGMVHPSLNGSTLHHPSAYLSAYLRTHPPTYPPACLPACIICGEARQARATLPSQPDLG